jgi:hypothetical protein
VSSTVLVCGAAAATQAARQALAARVADARVGAVPDAAELPRRAVDDRADLVVFLPGPIVEHERRVATIAALRREGFGGRVLYGGAFLSEKQDALAAGADLVFDPAQRPVEEAVAAALWQPLLAADHPYLRALFVGEWARVVPFGPGVPAEAPDIMIVSTSSHPEAAFWSALADYTRSHRGTACIVVEDDEDESVHAEALSSGVQPYVPLAEHGLLHVHALVRRLLRETWLARVL